MFVDDLVPCGESEENLSAIGIRFVEMCRGRRLKVNVGKRNVMALNGEEGLESEVHLDEIRLEHVTEFKYLGCVLDESGTDGEECNKEVASGRRVAGAIRSQVNARGLQLEYASFA